MTFSQAALLFGAAGLAGVINSIAGGGTLITFPVMIWAGLSPLLANSTNTVSLVPGAFSSALGYRREINEAPRRFFYLLIPSLAGGLIGAFLLARTPQKTFASLVPYLIIFATLLFTIQEPIQKRLRKNRPAPERETGTSTTSWLIGASFYQFLVAIYGGYFGAGIGILMLAVLGMMGLSDIHQMNGVKSVFGTMINGIAALYFIFTGLVDWPVAVVMAVGAIIGGYVSPPLARKIGRAAARRIIIIIGLAMAISLLLRRG